VRPRRGRSPPVVCRRRPGRLAYALVHRREQGIAVGAPARTGRPRARASPSPVGGLEGGQARRVGRASPASAPTPRPWRAPEPDRRSTVADKAQDRGC
jgi:hypothetical protein